ncbi:hypothetical protein HNQ60_005141 [Povalibacter uvarum]|uniref:Uncharacterized protein n=1 Tax=Povalibacter uvarum TaxID=732238 RepID=A0A841HVD5_9GAMM|nr:hypothetical protein [Povalibacter uvarum]MBB6096219.1 hypothetical protein [Povalibacter uvarum]
MPITTPDGSLDAYRGDEEHFSHVLSHLFQPAIEIAGMAMVSPIATGANLVHASIVDKIVKSDLVLCDMSGLNPNVFFEMGLRTALNQPLCFVVDDITESSIPFDAGIVNYHVYRSDLTPWTIKREIETLAAHIRTSVEQSKEGNALWRYFGLRAQFGGDGARPTTSSGDKLEYLTMEVEGLRRKFDGIISGVAAATSEKLTRSTTQNEHEISDEQVAGALLAFDPTTSSTEHLTTLSNQLRGRLKRTRTRTEEVAIERVLVQIEDTLKNRTAPT